MTTRKQTDRQTDIHTHLAMLSRWCGAHSRSPQLHTKHLHTAVWDLYKKYTHWQSTVRSSSKRRMGFLFENCVISLESMLTSHTVHYRITAWTYNCIDMGFFWYSDSLIYMYNVYMYMYYQTSADNWSDIFILSALRRICAMEIVVASHLAVMFTKDWRYIYM